MRPPRLPQLCKQNPRRNKIQVSVYLLKPENRAKQPVAGKPGRDEPRRGSPRGAGGTGRGWGQALGTPCLSGHACNTAEVSTLCHTAQPAVLKQDVNAPESVRPQHLCRETETPAVTQGSYSGLRHRWVLAEPAEKGQKPHSCGKRCLQALKDLTAHSQVKASESAFRCTRSCFPSVSVHTMASRSVNPRWERGCPP